MKKTFSILVLMAMAVMCVTSFTACSSGDDDDLNGLEMEKLTVGTHRIDVDFVGVTTGWDVMVSYCGSSYPIRTGGSTLYENSRILDISSVGVWISEEFRSYSVSTDDKSQSLVVTVTLLKNKGAVVQPVTVNMKGFVNGIQKTMKSVVVDGSHSNNTFYFYSEVPDGYQEIYLDY